MINNIEKIPTGLFCISLGYGLIHSALQVAAEDNIEVKAVICTTPYSLIMSYIFLEVGYHSFLKLEEFIPLDGYTKIIIAGFGGGVSSGLGYLIALYSLKGFEIIKSQKETDVGDAIVLSTFFSLGISLIAFGAHRLKKHIIDG